MNHDPLWAREYRDTREANRLLKLRDRRPRPVTLSDNPCVYCGLKATLGDPATCWEHRDLPALDGPYGGVFA